MRHVYLDNAATTPLRQEVILAMQEALSECYGNPSSTHAFGRKAKTGIEKARKSIAARLGAKPGEIIFTSGGTEADNMILRCAVRDLNVRTLITTKIEHHAVLHVAEALEHEYDLKLEYIPLDEKGNPRLDALEELLSADDTVKLVSLMHVNNEIGNILDLHAFGSLCRKYNAYFHSDTVQSVGHYPMDFSELPVDFATAAAHKFHGPKGVGFAFIRKNTGLGSLIMGGSQERGYRAGTEAYHNIVGLEAAFNAAYDKLQEEQAYVAGLKSSFIEQLRTAIPDIAFNGWSSDPERSTYTLVNFRLPLNEQQAQMLLFHLDLQGVACSKGSACQSGSQGGSHVLNEILDETERLKPSLRISFSHFTEQEDVDYAVSVLKDFVAQQLKTA